jgi:DNA-binding XRE family transcriptional regulator
MIDRHGAEAALRAAERINDRIDNAGRAWRSGGHVSRHLPQGEIGKYGRGTGVPHPTDMHVGKRIRTRRRFLGMNQQTLADKLGLAFQQVQKYEAGANRVGASALSTIADALRVPVSFFFANSPTFLPTRR